jgi:hypothetical protein
MKYPGVAPWRISQLALPRCFLAIDGDYFANPEIFAAFNIYTSQWSSLVYTTGSHTPTAPRARAIIELNRSVNRAEGIALGEAVERMLISALGANNIKLDESVYRAEQSVYTPLVGAQTHRFRGLPLDVDAVLAAYPSPTVPAFISSTPQQQVLVSPVTSAILQPPETPTEIAKAHAALAMVSADCSYPDWIEILFALQSTGWNCAKTLAQG